MKEAKGLQCPLGKQAVESEILKKLLNKVFRKRDRALDLGARGIK
ncbi:hypothetical protein ACV229_16205 [Burkholderia sp. MR1-5-21]